MKFTFDTMKRQHDFTIMKQGRRTGLGYRIVVLGYA